jgi:adenosylcobinamide-GDP ribazoletransferase
MKKIWNSLLLAFAMYSKIPVPGAGWEKENMRYVLCCFPLVGVVIGALMYGWGFLAEQFELAETLRACGYVLIPLLVTGGIHMDGFIDTCDALHSYGDREKKLEILKDPHVGAFGIICALGLFVATLGLMSQLSTTGLRCLCIGFVISRCISGWSVAVFPCAKNTGLASTFHDAAHRKMVAVLCCLEYVAALAIAFYVEPVGAFCMSFAAVLTLLWYYFMSKNQFGGITGDLAGWFLQMCECLMAAAVVAGDLLWF